MASPVGIGRCQGYALPSIYYFSFPCSFKEQLAKIIIWWPHLWDWRPRLVNEPRVNSRNLLEVFQYLPHFIFPIFDSKGLVIFHFIKLYESYNGRSIPFGFKTRAHEHWYHWSPELTIVFKLWKDTYLFCNYLPQQ